MSSQFTTRGIRFPVMQEIALHLGLPQSQHQSRIARAIDIINRNPMVEVYPTTRCWHVLSQYQPQTYYQVTCQSNRFTCDCPDMTPICKHIIAVWLSQSPVREQVSQILTGSN